MYLKSLLGSYTPRGQPAHALNIISIIFLYSSVSCTLRSAHIKNTGICRCFLYIANDYLTVVVALRFHFQTSSPEPWTNGRSLP